MFKVFHLGDCPSQPMKGERGEQIRLVNADVGSEALDVHLNRLKVGEPGGLYHHHNQSDNVYIVKSGEGTLVVEGETHIIREDDVIYIPAGMKHSLTNKGDTPFEIFEIYAPAGAKFDFVADE